MSWDTPKDSQTTISGCLCIVPETINLTMKILSLSHPSAHPVKIRSLPHFNFWPRGLGQINLKSLECKISRTLSDRSLPEIPESDRRLSEPEGLCGYLHLHLDAIPRIFNCCFQIPSLQQNCQMTKSYQEAQYCHLWVRMSQPTLYSKVTDFLYKWKLKHKEILWVHTNLFRVNSLPLVLASMDIFF